MYQKCIDIAIKVYFTLSQTLKHFSANTGFVSTGKRNKEEN